MNKKTNKAFSLIELSIVILIIGILVAGVFSASQLYSKFKVTVAQNLTKSSPVNSIKDLGLWYETSLDESFSANQNFDGNTISNWYDINSQKTIKNHATQSTSSSCTACPIFKENIINGLPVIRFDGSNDSLTISDPNFVIGTSYTIFIVGSRSSNKSVNFFIAGSGTESVTDDDMLHFGFISDTAIRVGQGNDDLDYSVSAYTVSTPLILVGGLDAKNGKRFFYNNASVTPTASDSSTTTLISNADMSLGNLRNLAYFQGDIAEVIIFNRYLSNEERISITNYLSKKYNITVSL